MPDQQAVEILLKILADTSGKDAIVAAFNESAAAAEKNNIALTNTGTGLATATPELGKAAAATGAFKIATESEYRAVQASHEAITKKIAILKASGAPIEAAEDLQERYSQALSTTRALVIAENMEEREAEKILKAKTAAHAKEVAAQVESEAIARKALATAERRITTNEAETAGLKDLANQLNFETRVRKEAQALMGKGVERNQAYVTATALVASADEASMKAAADATAAKLAKAEATELDTAATVKNTVAHRANSRAIFEGQSIIRDLMSGRTGRIPGSLSILAGSMGMGGGGMFAGIAAGSVLFMELASILEDLTKQEVMAREGMIRISDEANRAASEIRHLNEESKNFWTNLESKAADKTIADNIKQRTADLKNLAGVLGGNAPEQAKASEAAADVNRAKELQTSIDSLTAQLKRIQDAQGGDAGLQAAKDLEAAKDDLKAAQDAFKKGEGYQPKSNLLPSGFKAETSGQAWFHPWDYADSAKAAIANYQKIIADEDAKNKATADHSGLVQGAITRMTAELAELNASLTASKSGRAATDFGAAAGIGNAIASGQKVDANSAQFLIIFEQAITGQKQTLENAVKLIHLQTQNVATTATILEWHKDQIATVQSRLTALEQHH